MDFQIVYLNSNLFNYYPNILERIKYIGNSCGFQVMFYRNTTLVFYFYMKNFSSINTKYILNTIEQNTNQILGFIRVQDFKNYLEIYDACVLEKYRRQGIIKTIFKDLIRNKLTYYDFFWLGVDMRNFMRDQLISLYLSLGFEFESIRTNTPSGENIPFTILSMVLEKNFKIKTLQETKLEIFKALSTIRCSLKLYLDYEDALFINDNYSASVDTEYAGSMSLESYFDGYMLKTTGAIKGTQLEVKIPQSFVSWHTHPNICYKQTGCYIGWPSGADMETFLLNYYMFGSILNLVFSAEGLYMVRLTEEMMRFIYVISHEQDWVSAISDLVNYRFTFLESFRSIYNDIERLKCLTSGNEMEKCLFYQNPNQKEQINKFLNKANNFKIRDYIVTGQEYTNLLFRNYPIDIINKDVLDSINYYENFSKTSANFPLFKVEYVSTYNKDIVGNLQWINLNFLQAPSNPYCPKKN